MNLSHIVACTENGVIGREGGMPWHLPSDFKFFKRKTTGNILIMGRKTYDSIGRPLKDRLSIVVSRSGPVQCAPEDQERVRSCSSLGTAFEIAASLKADWGDEAFIIGGGEIYRQTMDAVDTVYLTRIQKEISGDTYYPIDALKSFERTEVSPLQQEGDISFCFETWTRK